MTISLFPSLFPCRDRPAQSFAACRSANGWI